MLPKAVRRLVTALLLMEFFKNAALAVVPPLLAHLSASIGLSSTQAGGLIGVFGISRLVITLPLGLYLSRVSRASRVVWAGLALSFAGTVLFGVAWGYPWLLLGRALVGMGHGMTYLATLVLILHFCPRSHVGRVINIWEAVSVASLVVHAFLGGLVGDQWGWRAAFIWAAASVALSGGLLALGPWRVMGATARDAVLGVTPDRSISEFVPAGRGILYALVGVTTFTLSVCWTGVLTTLIPLYGGAALGLGPSQIGAVLSVAYLVDIVLLFPAGRAMDRHSRTILLLPALLVLMVGVLLLPHTGSFLAYLAVSAFFAAGFVIWNVPSTLIADLHLGSRQGFVLGVVRFVADSATFIGPVGLGYLVERAGYDAAAWSVGLLVGGNLLFAVLGRVRRWLPLSAPHAIVDAISDQRPSFPKSQ